eukprot:TRINITY_DN66052_c0_g1_i1.p1 TRINITY_DN66052_c0_g1~~TRINITY_DN66052_c0_g1_i1.p1  ORF type:complete len:124 (-),score=23.95 TRINITY_DN66052_c0_g1_i1:112-483(-)
MKNECFCEAFYPHGMSIAWFGTGSEICDYWAFFFCKMHFRVGLVFCLAVLRAAASMPEPSPVVRVNFEEFVGDSAADASIWRNSQELLNMGSQLSERAARNSLRYEAIKASLQSVLSKLNTHK